MTNEILGDEDGNILGSSGQAVTVDVDATAPNGIALDASLTIFYDPERPDATVLRATIATQPDPGVADQAVVHLEFSADGMRRAFQVVRNIFEGPDEFTVNLDVPAGSALEDLVAYFMPRKGEDGAVGQPDTTTPVEVEIVDTTPVVVSLVTPPSITTETLIEGNAFSYAPGVYTGTPQLATAFEVSDDQAGSVNVSVIEVTGSQIPATAAGKYFCVRETVTGYGLADPLVTRSARKLVYPAIEIVPDRLLAADITVLKTEYRPDGQSVWYTPVLQFPGLAGETINSIRWTTKTGDYPDEQYIEEAVYETTQVPAELVHLLPPDAVPGEYRIFMETIALNDPGASPRTDYSVWQRSDAWVSSLRFSWQAVDGGAWSPMGDAVTVSVPAAVVTPNDGRAISMVISRTVEQFNAGEWGGIGLQFFRDRAYTARHPERWIGSCDVGWPIITEDWGGWWEPIQGDGLVCAVNGNSIAASAFVNDLVIISTSAAWRRQYPGWSAYEGLYRSTDGGKSWSLVQNIPYIPGTSGEVRRKKSLICEVSATEWYYAERLMNGVTEIWRSTNAGVNWTRIYQNSGDPFGSEMYGLLYHLGYLWIAGRSGLWRATPGSSISPTKMTSGLPSSGDAMVREMCKHGSGALLVGYGPNGVFRTTNASSFSAFYSGVPLATTLQASPVNPSRIMDLGCTSHPNSSPYYAKVTANNGGSWSNPSNDLMLGQVESFSQSLGRDYCGVTWHGSRELDAIVVRMQHIGRTTDGGFTTQWASNNFDWLRANGIGFHPTNWQVMAMGLQDRGAMFTKTAWQIGLEDDSEGDVKAYLQNTLGLTPQFTGTSIVMSPYSDDTAVCCMGNEFKHVPVLLKPGGAQFWTASVLATANSHSLAGQTDPTEFTRAYLGLYRVSFSGSGNASVYNTGKDFAGLHYRITGGTGAGRIYATDGNGLTIYRNDNNGASGSWVTHHTATHDFRPQDGRTRICVCPHVLGRLYWASSDGRAYRLEGSTETVIFDLRDFVSGIPRPELDSVAVDFFNPEIIYVAAAIYGKPVLYRTTNGGSTWSAIAGIPQRHGHIWVHPLTSDALWSSLSGNRVIPPPDGHRDYYGIANSVYDTTRAYLEGATV